MTRFSASRGIMYTAPPTGEDATDDVEESVAEPVAADD